MLRDMREKERMSMIDTNIAIKRVKIGSEIYEKMRLS